MFGTSVTPDSSLKSSFHSLSIPSKENSYAGQNNSQWKNKAVDQLLVEFDQEWNSKKRTQILKKIESYVYEELPILPLYHRKEAVLTPKNLVGYVEDLEGTNFVYPEKWKLQ
jgi:peptide/nickel transport system substrate-binding protein